MKSVQHPTMQKRTESKNRRGASGDLIPFIPRTIDREDFGLLTRSGRAFRSWRGSLFALMTFRLSMQFRQNRSESEFSVEKGQALGWNSEMGHNR